MAVCRTGKRTHRRVSVCSRQVRVTKTVELLSCCPTNPVQDRLAAPKAGRARDPLLPRPPSDNPIQLQSCSPHGKGSPAQLPSQLAQSARLRRTPRPHHHQVAALRATNGGQPHAARARRVPHPVRRVLSGGRGGGAGEGLQHRTGFSGRGVEEETHAIWWSTGTSRLRPCGSRRPER